MDAFSFHRREVELEAINVVQGVWVVERQRVLRTTLGSCISVCLHDPVAQLGGMNHFVYPPRNGDLTTDVGASTMYADICLEGLLEALLRAGAKRGRLRAKAFGGGAMFERNGGPLAIGKRNASYAKYWLEREGIPLTLCDFHGNSARNLMFHPASGDHLCTKLPATPAAIAPRPSFAG